MLKPFLAGSAMAAMMLWMGHDRIMSGTADLTAGAVLFALAHVAVVALILGAAFFFPGVRRVVRGHRPSPGHMATMLAGMAATAGVVHLVLHGAIL